MKPNELPKFSIYRKRIESEIESAESDVFLHILYLVREDKSLSPNANAHQLESFCKNKFYGPIVVAKNSNDNPSILQNFTLADLHKYNILN